MVAMHALPTWGEFVLALSSPAMSACSWRSTWRSTFPRGLRHHPATHRRARYGVDQTKEVNAEEFRLAKGLTFTADRDLVRQCNFFVVTMPTPIDSGKRPDLKALEKASETVGSALSPASVVVYSGASEKIFAPLIEKASGLVFNTDFFRYSPERLNPGDMQRRLPSIMKIRTGDVPDTYASIDELAEATGFRPSTPIEEGVRRFVAWYREFYDMPTPALASANA